VRFQKKKSKNRNINEFAIVGVEKSVFLARKIFSEIAKFVKICESRFPFGTMDVTLHMNGLDNFGLGGGMPLVEDTIISFDIRVEKYNFNR
jgi:hypothetical protein